MSHPDTPAFADSVAVREHLVRALRLDLVGPCPDDAQLQTERLPDAPSRWYLTGFLAPTDAPDTQLGQDSGEELDEPAEPAQGGDDASTPERGSGKRLFLPSSMGLSLLVDKTAGRLRVSLSWGDYTPEEVEAGDARGTQPAGAAATRRKVNWIRVPRFAMVEIGVAELAGGQPSRFRVPDSGGLELACRVRPTRIGGTGESPDPLAVSLFVVNRRPAATDSSRQDTAFAFQVEMRVDSDRPLVARTDPRGSDSEDWDERLADLHYRDAAAYAVGHSVSTRAEVRDGACHRVQTDWMPRAAVERVEPVDMPGVEFGMEVLGGFADGAAARRALAPLVVAYRVWIEGQRREAGALSGRRQEVAEALVEGANQAAKRIEGGIEQLDNADVLEAFRIANRAMAAAARRRSAQAQGREPEKVDPPRWRPFQLAYLLMNLRGIADPTHAERKFVDLLFFPTGGGKTEAYLGLAAFTLVLRRLRDPDPVHCGLSVLMRYTLRLLTLDQLGRATALVCALELERKTAPERLGVWPFEIALWVGRAATPNHMGQTGDGSRDTARARTLRFSHDTSGEPPLPLNQCPWCGTPFGKKTFQLHPDTSHPKELHVHCANRRCDFAQSPGLPVVAVDEPIYARQPAFMIATIDKFAAMPWTGEVARLFQGGDPSDPRPPDLIIQDELHLVSGPLGTMAGLYETAVDHLCRRRIDGGEVRPKIIASTATVRLAGKQIRALFGRSSVAVFPAPGIDRRDSFFAEQASPDRVSPRLYIGVAAQGRGPRVIFLRSAITLMAAAEAAWKAAGRSGSGANPADPYMTLVAYFNALRELGSARRIVEDEISSRLQTYAKHKRIDEPGGVFANRMIALEPVELTSRVGTASVADSKRRLSLGFGEPDRVDVALATNMISVGLDITRLGLMLVSGQPKTTAEYIQATSRVGRDADRPGLVVTLLNVHKPRDRSHYERFAAWHESFYRGVEATSVTPFSPRAMDRGLAAVTVAMARLGIPELRRLKAAGSIENHAEETRSVARALAGRAGSHAEGLPEDTADKVRTRVQSLLDDWARIAHEAREVGVSFGYRRGSGSGVSTPLLREMLDPDRGSLQERELRFRAPRSLRDVEPSVPLGICNPDGKRIGEGKTPQDQLRQSQLVTTYGPGAMLDLPVHSAIVSGLQEWSGLSQVRIDEPRLVAKLGHYLKVPQLELRTPPQPVDNSKKAPVSVRIFPTWFIVKEAKPSPRNGLWRRRRLVRWADLNRGQFRDEDGKRKPVVPVRFVSGCRHGHIDDLNWRGFIHGSGQPCLGRPLWLEERGAGADLGSTYGVCDCGAERSLYEASNPGSRALGACRGSRPWLGRHASEDCSEPLRLLVRTASNAYFPQLMRVVSLPDSDSGLAAKVQAQFQRLDMLEGMGAWDSLWNFPDLRAAFANFDVETVRAEYRRQAQGGPAANVPVKTAEFSVLNSGSSLIGKDDPHASFFAETPARDAWDRDSDPLLDRIDKLVLVHRLREVVALLGFTRFEATSPRQDGELDLNLNVAPAALADGITWLPAMENRGEGIFLSFRPDAVAEWLQRPAVRQRGQQLKSGWEEWARARNRPADGLPDLPYVMLHSLSHMLMTSIALDCGYPASSLRERVYAGDGGYGILIYTGSADSEGTLGGLVEAGRRLGAHLRRAVEDGRLCSNDPVCADHAPNHQLEGRQLHGAACHGCLLIAETSCEHRNDFLDRALVVPTVGTADAAFLDPDRTAR